MADVSDVPGWMDGETEASEDIAAGRVTVHGDVDSMFRDLGADRWEPGDVVLADDGQMFCRAAPHHTAAGYPWAYCRFTAPRDGVGIPVGGTPEDLPKRPLTLLARNGRPVVEQFPRVPGSCCTGERWGTVRGDGVGVVYLRHTDGCPLSAGKFEEIAVAISDPCPICACTPTACQELIRLTRLVESAERVLAACRKAVADHDHGVRT